MHHYHVRNNVHAAPIEPNKELFHARMYELIKVLQKYNVDLKKMDAVELFARGGDWHTTAYADKVRSLEVWEIDIKWKSDLRKNLPKAKIKIIDTIKTLRSFDNLPKFDLIVIDNPMNLYGPSINNIPQYCEHFEVLENIAKLVNKEAVLVFNINKKPINYEQWPLWKKRREEFYGVFNTDNLKIDFLFDFYKKLFLNLGFETILHECIKRHDYLDYFVYKIKKVSY